jgi:hypothetical protein
MKSLLFLFGMIVAAGAAAQTYTYQPLALDTSCFWSSEYLFYDGGYVCHGERLSVVTGDTLIGGQRFTRILTYTTEAPHPEVPMCNTGYLGLDVVTLVREDTSARKVYYADGSTAIDFNLNIGDTLLRIPPLHLSVVDSINIQRIMGVDRKVQWASAAGPNNFRYQTIEGIGMNYNFPVRAFGEWGVPVYRLQCYSKSGQVLYTNGSTVNCSRKPPLSLSISAPPGLGRTAFAQDGTNISILNSNLLPLNVQVFDMAGKLLRTDVLRTSAPFPLEVMPGSYVIRLWNNQHSGSFLIAVQ